MSISTWAATTGDWDDAKFSRAWNGPYINPAVGSLALTGYAPSDSTGFNIGVGKADLELIQTYDWQNVPGQWNTADWEWDQSPIVPTISIGKFITPSGATFTFTASIPSVDELHHTIIPSASLTITGYVPHNPADHLAYPGAASLTGLSQGDAWDESTSTWATIAGNWGTGVSAPTVGVTYTFVIDAAGNLVLTPYDPEYPLVADPKFIPSIFIS
jgi:hypothetical protein